MGKLIYPPARLADQADDYHGVRVPDPYRWLEDTDSEETQAWITAQNVLTFAFLEDIPARPWIQQRLADLWDFPRALPPQKRGERYFQLRNTGLQNQDVLWMLDGLDSEPRLLLDPNVLSEDGTVALVHWEVSEDGRWLAYATSASGSDWLTWRVREVETAQDLPDTLEWGKFSSAAWLPDGSGFYYARYAPPEPGESYAGVNYYQKLYFHRLGQPQESDELVYERPDQKEWGFQAQVSEDGCFLVLHVWQGTDTRNRLFYQDLRTRGEIIELIPDLEAAYEFVGNDGTQFYLRTDLDAPMGKLVQIDTARPAKSGWKILLAESPDALEKVHMVGDQFVALYLHDASHRIRLFNLEGIQAGEVPLPTLGSVSDGYFPGVAARRQDREMFYLFHSFAFPPTIFRYDFERQRVEAVFTAPVKFDFSPYETRQVFVPSKDGTRVPLFLVHRRDVQLNRSNPAFLYGYGGFNVSLTPAFSVSRLVWLQMGGILAFANLRGGGEYGKKWHEGGMLDRKQNVFDDFIACAEYLIGQGFTSAQKLAIHGGSNGGLLVGACMTQRPELFGAAVPAVGVMDMLRFHKFTIGWAWVSDYGSSDDPQAFKTLLAYSPLHNLRQGVCYPPTLVLTADHDDRVVPGHSFKFAARLQAVQSCDAPVLIRIQTRAGHGFGKPTSLLIAEQADLWSFLVKVLEVDYKPQAVSG